MLVLMNGEGRVGMDAAVLALEAGKSALDVVEAGIRPVEADPAVRTVGFGGYPNLAGVVECDAAIMDGVTRECGSVGALSGYLHAIQVARQVMERLPHVMLVGDGAARFAAEVGATEAEMLSEESEVWHRQRQSARLANALNGREALAAFCWPKDGLHTARGTTVLLCRDKEGRLAGGTSTSGWAHKYPGRLGDSPIIGAGLYVDQRYGACACTHTGGGGGGGDDHSRGDSSCRCCCYVSRRFRSGCLPRGTGGFAATARRLPGICCDTRHQCCW